MNNEKEMTIQDYFQEWERNINELQTLEIQLLNLKETYNQLSEQIIAETDFKTIYGKNNEKIRKTHVDNELKDIVDEKHDKEIRKNYLLRRIDFIKGLMRMQGTLIDAGVINE